MAAVPSAESSSAAQMLAVSSGETPLPFSKLWTLPLLAPIFVPSSACESPIPTLALESAKKMSSMSTSSWPKYLNTFSLSADVSSSSSQMTTSVFLHGRFLPVSMSHIACFDSPHFSASSHCNKPLLTLYDFSNNSVSSLFIKYRSLFAYRIQAQFKNFAVLRKFMQRYERFY